MLRIIGKFLSFLILIFSTELYAEDCALIARSVARTIGFYNRMASNYGAATLGIDSLPERTKFLKYLTRVTPSPIYKILDVGTGSGRDAAEFKSMGFEVTAMDATPGLAAFAEGIIKQPVLVKKFTEIDWENEFDGIWAMASLIHTERNEMPDIIQRIKKALRTQGILLISLTNGQAPGATEFGLRYTEYSESEMVEFLEQAGGFNILVRETFPEKNSPDRTRVQIIAQKI